MHIFNWMTKQQHCFLIDSIHTHHSVLCCTYGHKKTKNSTHWLFFLFCVRTHSDQLVQDNPRGPSQGLGATLTLTPITGWRCCGDGSWAAECCLRQPSRPLHQWEHKNGCESQSGSDTGFENQSGRGTRRRDCRELNPPSPQRCGCMFTAPPAPPMGR